MQDLSMRAKKRPPKSVAKIYVPGTYILTPASSRITDIK